ncbi:polysaccharide export protein [Erythrobacter sp. KY5]|uniref:polysaccharide biosynthesis/export family protein n=1 Tax=Erythrobacter sp. KY5 TaxID=2011159 RepID=UPI000DBF220B|nr:polysaccharide biosynthesis/export family protein [Erythrobacter sp. KY5]AWW73143.1 polysaccharide export protein [Erythrobacter sp. KY5]
MGTTHAAYRVFAKRLGILLCASSLLTACASAPPLGGAPGLDVVSASQLPTPIPGAGIHAARPYHVGPFDKLRIDVFGIEELSDREVQVDAAGRVSFPLVGSIEAAGKTPSAIEAELENALSAQFIRNPQVTVNLEETVSQVVTVDGQVREPGLYPVIGRMTLMQGVATASGLTEFAKVDDVVVFREADGQRYAALYNLGAIRRGIYSDPEIYAGDVVVVGESNSRRLFRDILAATPLLTAPIIALLQN